ncbi:MAG: GNAT family N-acetyltransferase [Planctomycetes bacterium]|nr:GNAT family N-acetyltransferase [Planctomycetota bacterium]
MLPFTDAHAHDVASWVLNDRELLWLAPGTPPPLTVQKVLSWGLEHRCRMLLSVDDCSTPLGYAELNMMPSRVDQFWIGHFILSPEFRGIGMGYRFAQALLAHAFVKLNACDVLLVVFPENHLAIRCYTRAGFVSLGREHKYFELTGRRHEFLRMGIHVARYRRLVHAGKLSTVPVAYGVASSADVTRIQSS